MFKREVEKAAAAAMSDPGQSLKTLLQETADRIQRRLDEIAATGVNE